MARRSTFVVVVVLLLGGCAGRPVGSGPPPGSVTVGTAPPSVALGSAPTPPALAVPPVDAVAGRALLTADGRRVALDGVGPADGGAPDVVRVPAGWLATTWAYDGATLWLVGEDGQHRSILTGAAGIAVAPGGRRLAYRVADQVIVADLAASGLTEVARTGGVGRFHPYLLGRDTVVLAYSETGGELENFDTWRWALGPYRPTPTNRYIVGALPDGSALIGMVASDASPCLALFDAATLAPTRTACVPGVLVGPHPAVSPDGRWLFVRQVADGGPGAKVLGNPIGVVDLDDVFAHPVVAASWPDDPVRIIDAQHCVWTDDATALCGAERGLVRLRVDRPEVIEYLPLDLPSGGPAPVVPIVDLRR